MNEPTAYSELNPFTAIWTRPRETVRYVIEEKQDSFIFLLLLLIGFSGGLSGASGNEEFFPVLVVILGSLVLGPLFGALGIAIVSGIYKLIGKMFGGEGTYSEMFRAVVTSSIPQLWLLPMWLVWLLVSPETFYTDSEASFEESGGILGLIALIAIVTVGIWTFIIQCKAVGEAQRISAWKGFFIILIPSILLAGVFIFFVVFILFAAF